MYRNIISVLEGNINLSAAKYHPAKHLYVYIFVEYCFTVLPSNTPNVRRTKRIRLKPLEYWRGERVDYQERPSGKMYALMSNNEK